MVLHLESRRLPQIRRFHGNLGRTLLAGLHQKCFCCPCIRWLTPDFDGIILISVVVKKEKRHEVACGPKRARAHIGSLRQPSRTFVPTPPKK
mmetsp:Transcript_114915/g.228722  ORF Transcript_114915/g.228722 Transcript_114915/m.228722 type:complete len:92 (-) Transcript_114915:52-327(-)